MSLHEDLKKYLEKLDDLATKQSNLADEIKSAYRNLDNIHDEAYALEQETNELFEEFEQYVSNLEQEANAIADAAEGGAEEKEKTDTETKN